MKYNIKIPHVIYTFATAITVVRIFLVIPLVVATSKGLWGSALGLVLLAGLTDVCDGLIARHMDQVTEFGALLDPVADKLFLIGWYGAMMSSSTIIPFWFTLFVIIRESVLMAGAAYYGLICHTVPISADRLGKAAMGAHILFMVLMLGVSVFGYEQEFLREGGSMVASCVVAVLVVASTISYVLRGLGLRSLLCDLL